MTVFVLDRAPQSLRGALARYMIEVRAGLFIGRLDARMRELLWEKCLQLAGAKTRGVVLWRTNNAQGFGLEAFGEDRRMPVEYDGLVLIGERGEG